MQVHRTWQQRVAAQIDRAGRARRAAVDRDNAAGADPHRAVQHLVGQHQGRVGQNQSHAVNSGGVCIAPAKIGRKYVLF